MAKIDKVKVGDGKNQTAIWCEDRPVVIFGLGRFPEAGDRFKVHGEMWRVVEITDRYLCEREAN